MRPGAFPSCATRTSGDATPGGADHRRRGWWFDAGVVMRMTDRHQTLVQRRHRRHAGAISGRNRRPSLERPGAAVGCARRTRWRSTGSRWRRPGSWPAPSICRCTRLATSARPSHSMLTVASVYLSTVCPAGSAGDSMCSRRRLLLGPAGPGRLASPSLFDEGTASALQESHPRDHAHTQWLERRAGP